MDRSGVLFPNIIESQDELDSQTLLGLESSSSIYLNSYSKDSFEEESSSYDNSKDISNSVNDYVKSEHDEDNYLSSGSSIKTEVITQDDLLHAISSSSSINDIGPVFTGLQPTSETGTPSIKRGPGRPRKDKFEGLPLIKGSPSWNKLKKLGGGVPSANHRGIRGRKKPEGLPGSFSGNFGSSFSSDLSMIGHESPPRFTEDTMESDTSSVSSSLERLHEDLTLFPEQWPGRLCALCNLGEKSMSGQGELLRIDLPKGFDPVTVSSSILALNAERNFSHERISKLSDFAKPQKGIGQFKRLTSQGSAESIAETDEIVGHTEEPDLNSVFDVAAGCFYVHYQCALWCGSTKLNEDKTFSNLEYEIVKGLSQRCYQCNNYGAALMCIFPECQSVLHLPCAAASGSFQDMSSLSTICVDHIEQVIPMLGDNANCTVCDEPSNPSSMVMCSSCGNHYHTNCMLLSSDPGIRPGWQCPACKLCQACRQPGDENKLLPCETCDKAYHIFCLRPVLSSIPKHSWKCKLCRICTDCGARTPGSGPSSRWHGNFSVCDSCYQQRNKGLACPICGKAYRHVAQKLMLQCFNCKKFVHGACDPNAELAAYQRRKESSPDYEYACAPCRSSSPSSSSNILSINCSPKFTGLSSNTQQARGSEKDQDLLSISTPELNINGILSNSVASSSQDSLLFTEEESMASSTDLTSSIITTIALSDKLQNRLSTADEMPAQKPLQPKKRNGVGRPRSTEKNCNSVGNKRNRLSELTTRKRGPKPKIRGIFGTPGLQRPSTETPSIKGEDEPGVENRLVLCSAKDDFVLEQDVCVMCGAFGNDHEGCLISCSQCGQCYHPYCVNVKVTKVILQKGWRCLDCTVCEGCGQRHDEARLILCDDCDISFHIYCMNPPLEHVPRGNWKCKWCAVCHVCGSNDPGVNCRWHKNYTLCGPCNSYNSCPVCSNGYTEGELIIACSKCDRWLHTNCDSITCDDDAEKCTELGYTCILCRPKDLPPPHLLPSPLPALLKTPPRSPDLSKSRSQSQFSVDGVVLSNSGMTFMRNLSLDTARKKRKKMPNHSDMEAGILAAIESVVSGSTKSDGDKSAEEGGDKDLKRRGRNVQKFGIGGFFARIRGPRQKDDDYDGSNDNQIIGESADKSKRKPARRKVKNKYTEIFPAYLQEAFFGKPLLETNREIDSTTGAADLNSDGDVITSLAQQSTIKLSNEEVQALEGMKGRKDPETIKLPKAEAESCDTKKSVTPHVKMEEESDELQDIIPLEGDLLDNELVNTIMNDSDDISKVHESLDDLASVRDLVGDGELNMDHGGEEGNHKDELEFLSSQLNFGSGLPSMDSKDVEDVFKGVLTEDSQEAPEPLFSHLSNSLPPQSINPAPTMPPKTIPAIPSPSIINHPPVLQSVQSSSNLPRGNPINQNVTQGLASPLNFPPPSPYHSEYSNSPQFSPAFSEPPSPWPQPQGDTEIETPNNYNQRSLLKWEVDESLGLSATISAVLYCNMNHPELKRDHPNWNERSKQISKIWRSLPTDKRAPYLQKARENRAASRIQKAQQEQDTKLMPPVTSKVGRTETVEERQWKQMQAFRQQQAHQQQMALQDHRVSIDQKPELGSNNLGSPKHQYSTGIVSQGQRHLSGDMIPQPLQVSTNNPQDVLSAPLSSPHLQSPTARQVQFSSMTQQTRMRPPNLEMPPPSPSPHYSPRPSMPQQNSPLMCRSPMYSRISYIQSPRQQVGNVGDPYENAPMTPQQYSHPATPRPVNDNESLNASPETYQQQRGSTDGYGHQSGHSNEMDGVASPRTLAPQGQETRQHLRDLLQRQQLKRVDQEHGSSIPGEINSAPVPQRTLSWPQADDWHKQGGIDNNMGTKHAGLSSPTSPAPQQTQFRHPYMVSQVRSGKPQTQPQVIQGRPAEFRPNTDARVRLILQQHQSQSRPIPPPSRGQTFAIQQQHLASQQQPQYRTTPSYESPGKRLEGETMEINSSMLAQQLGRPLNPEMSGRMVQPGKVLPAQHPQPTNPSQSISQGLTNSGINSSQAESEHQELPDSVTAELEKLEQEQHHETGGDVDAGELADLGMDDDELLGMGADFNILEYADPELNNVVGEKTNILDDNLDLEEEKDDVKDEDKRKDDERHVKRENHTLRDTYATSSAPTLSQTGSTEPKPTQLYPSSSSQVHIGPTNPEYMQVQSQQSATSSDAILRPPPPPPYPGPPPPYPGRQQQVGSRNGVGGMSLQSVSVSPMMNLIFKNTESGNGNSRRSQQTLTTMNSNPIMTAHQRRTLLLQEQPLLLEDLLEQEKREQQRQGPALLGNVGEEPLLSDFDFERLKADVLSSSSLPVSLSPPNLPVGQGVICQQPPNINRTMSAPASQQQQQVLRNNEWMSDPTSRSQNVLGPMFSGGPGPNVVASQQSQHTSPQSRGQPFPMPSVPPPPVPPEHPITEQDRQMQVQYEQWLFHQQSVLTMQMKFFETEVAKLRKVKKALNTKQRQLRKNSNELNENDAQELERITKELSSIQKQLEQSRKQNRQHGAVVQEYKNKQLKRQQMLGMNQPINTVPSPGQVVIPSQSSPHQTSQSPLHSTPQSPMLSPAPIGSPMASPLAPSPGSGLAQQSGRGCLQSVHHLDDRPFSPNNETPMRPLPSPSGLMGSGRMTMQQPGAQMRMGNPVNSQMGQTHTMGMNMNQAGSQQQILINRGLISNVPHQQRPMYMDGSAMNQQRMRAATNVDQLRMTSMQARMPRSGITHEMLMRARMSNQAQFQNPNTPQMVKPSGINHYQNVQRVAFPSQSPTGGIMANLRSPSPLAQMGGLGSPTGNQGIMGQNRVSPASSPMRRPSGNQGMGSPLPDRPRSVENPLTPRSSGSGPHTPSGVQNMSNMGMDGLPGTPHSMCGGDLSNSGINSLDSIGHSNQSPNVPTSYMSQPMNSQNLQQHGGGGVNSHIIPFPTFSWFGGPNQMGLKGGNPFSVVNGETHVSAPLPTKSTTMSKYSSNSVLDPTPNSSPVEVPTNSQTTNANATYSSGESQNALLKQLLQNTACACMGQAATQPRCFSLSSCLQARPQTSALTLTCHLSEAATRIPQPTPVIRTQDSPTPSLLIKAEKAEFPIISTSPGKVTPKDTPVIFAIKIEKPTQTVEQPREIICLRCYFECL